MPLFDYDCGEHTHEVFFKAGQKVSDFLECPHCQKTAVKKLSAPAYTPGRWGDQTGKYGVNGFFDRGLGATYHTSMEREKLMEAKGLVSLSDFDDNYVEDKAQETIAHQTMQDANLKEYKENVQKFGGDKAKAIGETFSIEKMEKQGTLTSE